MAESSRGTCFISSTIHDLKDLRDILDLELSRVGFEMLLSEKGSIPADSSKHSYDACIDAAKSCDLLVAIIDGRYGGDVPGTGKSITQTEIEAALDAGRQVRVFVRKGVWDAKEVLRPYFKEGYDFLPSEVVKDKRVFDVVDALKVRDTGNWMLEFYDAREVLHKLAKQFGFEFSGLTETGVEKLDRLIARKVLSSFQDTTIRVLSHGYQTGRLSDQALCDADEACELFYPETHRFTDKDTNGKLIDFLAEIETLMHDGGSVFGPGPDPAFYVVRNPGDSPEMTKDNVESLRQLGERAVKMERAWKGLLATLRERFPDLVAELHKK